MTSPTWDVWHWVFSGIEVVSIIILFCWQGVLRPGNVWEGARSLLLRVWLRMKSCPRRKHMPALSGIFLVGSGALVVIGWCTSFFPAGVQSPQSPSIVLRTMAATFVMPGLIEELLFRGVLIRASCESDASTETEGTNAAHDTAPNEESDSESLVAIQENQIDLQEQHRCPRDESADSMHPPATKIGGVCQEGVPNQTDDVCKDVSKVAGEDSDSSGKVADRREPRLMSTRPPIVEQIAYMFIFTVYHLDAIHAPSMFRDARFISMAVVLGLCCQESCILSQSLWPGIFMHWLWVWAWLTFLFNMDLV